MAQPVGTSPDTVLIDCHHAGISGDMMLAALVDLGADRKRIVDEIARCTEGSGCIEMRVSKTKRASIACMKVDFQITGTGNRVDMGACIKKASDPWVRDRSLEVLSTLEKAEAKVHGRRKADHPHLHELGQLDAVADIVGCLTAWRDLCLESLDTISTRVALGGGKVVFSHGDFPIPAPATLEILRGKPVSIGGDRELTTPTGASLLVNLATSFTDSVSITPLRTGLGAGSDAGDFLNATRMVLGTCPGKGSDTVDVIETSVDDATPEALAHAMDRLMEEGALDVSIIPSIMKKGRPGSLVRVVSPQGDADRISEIVLRETGSLGARLQRGVERLKLDREVKSVSLRLGGKTHTVRMKVGIDRDGTVVSMKPEYSDVERICKLTGLEFPLVYRSILEASCK